MIDASSGGSEAGRSDDGFSDAASDSEYEGAGEFANVMNQMNNTAANGGEEEIDEEDDADDAGIGVQADDDRVVGAVAGVAPPPDGDAPPDGVAPAVARPRGRGPGRSRTLPIGPPAAAAVARNGSTAPAPAVACNGSDGQMSSSSGTAAGDRGRAFRTLINRGRKKSRTDDDNEGGFLVSTVMGMMMVQQRSEQSSREADRMAREVELSLRREEIAMRREEMTSQLQIQREESLSHQQMMNVMLMAMMQNIAGTNRGTNDQHQTMEIGGNNQQEEISGTIQQNDKNNN